MIRPLLLGATLWCCASAAVAEEPAPDCAAIADAASRLACYDAQRRPPEGAPAAPADGTSVRLPAAEAEGFGLPKAPDDKPTTIKARVVGPVMRWEKGTLFTLDNGQVWKAIDQQGGHYTTIPENPEVSIARSVFGAYWMEILAVGTRIKVKRIS